MKDRAPDSEGRITSTAETLRRRYRESLVLSRQVDQQISEQAELLAYELDGIVGLWHATFHPGRG
jgi:hypothetical protein